MKKLIIKIQCNYMGRTGTFLVDSDGYVQSPIFKDSEPLLRWLKKHFIYEWGKGLSINILKMKTKPDVETFGEYTQIN